MKKIMNFLMTGSTRGVAREGKGSGVLVGALSPGIKVLT